MSVGHIEAGLPAAVERGDEVIAGGSFEATSGVTWLACPSAMLLIDFSGVCPLNVSSRLSWLFTGTILATSGSAGLFLVRQSVESVRQWGVKQLESLKVREVNVGTFRKGMLRT